LLQLIFARARVGSTDVIQKCAIVPACWANLKSGHIALILDWMKTQKPFRSDLFEDQAAYPEGFRYFSDTLSRADEIGLVRQFATLPFKPFEFHGYLGNRRIVSYGFRYDYSGQALRKTSPIPEFLYPLRETASAASGIAALSFEQALITEYAPGAGIGWHRDKPMFDTVLALSFLEPCVLRFRRKAERGWLRSRALIAPRSCYVLSGEARQDWEHSIAPMGALRYSVTFRTFRKDYKLPASEAF
jgi:alkylated DNA repair dioxygenase AlkB